MDDFQSATYFTRYKLAHATDEQVHFTGLSIKERDNLLEKEILFIKRNSKDRTAALNVNKSVIKQTPYISYNEIISSDILLEVAAHEQAHAARFCERGLKSILMHDIVYGLPYLGGGIAMIAAFMQEWSLYFGGMAIIPTGKLLHGSFLPHEEKRAYRFGFLFSPETYIADDEAFSKIEEIKYTQKSWLANKMDMFDFYPSPQSIDKLFLETRKECTGGNILFPLNSPPDVAFQNWKNAGSPRV